MAADPGDRAGTPQGERRYLTILFCDLVGSTQLSMRLDPEELHEVLRAYLEACAGAVTANGGHVGEFLGDGLMAFFGFPRAEEDDAFRAVRAGLELIEAVKALPVGPGIELRTRVGIHTGLTVIGATSVDGRNDAIAGATPNIAARVQAAAPVDGVLVTPDTLRLVEGRFNSHALGPHELKGLPEPVELWQVDGLAGVTDRVEIARRAGRLAQLVGRDVELATLSDAWSSVPEGGRGYLVRGDAGIGKSRLMLALRERVVADGGWILEASCSTSHRNTPFHPAIQMLTDIASRGRTRRQSSHRALDWMLSRLTPHAEDRRVLSGLVLGTGTEGFGDEGARERVISVLSRALLSYASTSPGLIILEDMHWADPSTMDLFEVLVDRVADASALFAITCRPGFEPSWANAVQVMELNAISRDATKSLVASLAGDRVPAPLISMLAERADGVPLFAEELARAILESVAGSESDAGIGEPGIPATLHDTLMARLDQLPPRVRAVAQVASVVGREFSFDILDEVLPVSDVRDGLVTMARAGLVEESVVRSAGSYAFRHSLIRDAAYGSMLRTRRRTLHGRVAEILHSRFPDLSASEPEVLAHHFTAAGRHASATRYWYRAGMQALGRHASLEASRHLSRAVDLLGEDSDLLYECLVARVRACDVLADRDQQKADLARLADRGDDSASRRVQVADLTARFLWAIGSYDEAVATAREALETARGLDDQAAVVSLISLLSRLARAQGNYAEAEDQARRALDLHRAAHDRIGEATVTDILGGIAWERGDHRTAAELHRRAATAFEELGDPTHQAQALNNLGTALWSLGDYLAAQEVHERSVTLARNLGDRRGEGDNLDNLGGVAWVLGDYATARQRYEEALAIRRASRDPWGIGLSLVNLGHNHLETEDWEPAEQCFREALEVNRDMGRGRTDGGALQGLGVALTAQGRIGEGRAALEAALDSHRDTAWREGLIETHLGLAALELGGADTDAALEQVERSIELLDAGDRPALRQAVWLMASEVMTASGFGDDGRAYSAKAVAAMEEAASVLPFDLRHDFLARVPLNRRTRQAASRA